jgi:hypothetical protein
MIKMPVYHITTNPNLIGQQFYYDRAAGVFTYPDDFEEF